MKKIFRFIKFGLEKVVSYLRDRIVVLRNINSIPQFRFKNNEKNQICTDVSDKIGNKLSVEEGDEFISKLTDQLYQQIIIQQDEVIVKPQDTFEKIRKYSEKKEKLVTNLNNILNEKNCLENKINELKNSIISEKGGAYQGSVECESKVIPSVNTSPESNLEKRSLTLFKQYLIKSVNHYKNKQNDSNEFGERFPAMVLLNHEMGFPPIDYTKMFDIFLCKDNLEWLNLHINLIKNDPSSYLEENQEDLSECLELWDEINKIVKEIDEKIGPLKTGYAAMLRANNMTPISLEKDKELIDKYETTDLPKNDISAEDLVHAFDKLLKVVNEYSDEEKADLKNQNNKPEQRH